ncbi:methyltransferase domain-containing protein [Streptomyces sp. NPDC046805]|uniref:class I SAM-dependent methyltransferase n=1 Tax=Streptomyces sp. NPDC046805 TaxID=3155134 RepID=UPI0034087092
MWRGRAEAYGTSFARLCAHPVEALLDAAGVTAGARVLDAGTGTGTAALAARARGARVRAVDADAGMVAAARARGVAVQVGVLPDLPFPDGEFDVVVGNFVLNHVGRPRAALAGIRRVLRPGGRVAVTTWGARRGAGQELLGRACAAAGAVPPSYLPRLDPGEEWARTPEGLAGLLAEVGLREVVVREVAWDHRTTLEEWWGGAVGGVAAIGLVVAAQDAETVVRIKGEYERLSRGFGDDSGEGRLALPHVALLASAAV